MERVPVVTVDFIHECNQALGRDSVVTKYLSYMSKVFCST